MTNINFFKLKYYYTAIKVIILGLIGGTLSIFTGGNFSIENSLATMMVLISVITVFQIEYYSDWSEAIVKAIFLSLAPLGIFSIIQLLIFGQIPPTTKQVAFLLYQFSLLMTVLSWIVVSVLVAVRKESLAKLKEAKEKAWKELQRIKENEKVSGEILLIREKNKKIPVILRNNPLESEGISRITPSSFHPQTPLHRQHTYSRGR